METLMADNTMQLVLIRHGESEWNKLNLFTGWMDVDLTDTGRKEAAQGVVLFLKLVSTSIFVTPLTSSAQFTLLISYWNPWIANGFP